MTRLRFEPDVATMTFDDLLANGEAQAGAGVFSATMKPLEDREYLVGVAHVDANPVVFYREQPNAILPYRFNVDARCDWAAELYGIANKILKHMLKLRGIGQDSGQPSTLDGNAALVDRHTEVGDRPLERLAGGDWQIDLGVRPNSGVLKEAAHKLLHPLSTFSGESNEVVGIRVQLALVTALEQVAVTSDHTERLLKVVRRYISKLL